MKKLIIALDFPNIDKVMQFIRILPTNDKPILKVGMELFYATGSSIIKELQAQGFQIFLDLKLHDIPNTVEKAAFQLGKLGVQYTTIHALGGSKMIQYARRGLDEGARSMNLPKPKLLAITELTSISETALHDEQNVAISMKEQVLSLALLAKNNGADGVVCSPQEVTFLRKSIGEEFILVTPGIRPSGSPTDDQTRTFTPKQASDAGSSAIVVGRPITKSIDPKEAYLKIKKEWQDNE